MVTLFTLFCLLLFTGVGLQGAGFVLARRNSPASGFWLLFCGGLAVLGAAFVDGDPTLLLGQILASSVLARLLWNGFPALLEAAWPNPCRRHWQVYKGVYKQTAVFALAILAVLALPLLAPDTEALHRFLREQIGAAGAENLSLRPVLTYVGLAALLSCAAVPRQALSFVAGLLFGAWQGTVAATLATTLGCALAFGLSRTVTLLLLRQRAMQAGRAAIGMPEKPHQDSASPPPLQRLANRYRPQYVKLGNLLQRAPFLMAILIRLFPSGNNLLFSLLAGAMRLPMAAFVGGSCVGYIPQNLIFALMGSGVYGDGGWRIAVGVMLFAGATALGVWAWKKT